MRSEAPVAVVTVVALTVALVVTVWSGALGLVGFITPGELGPSAEVIRADFGAEAVPEGKTGYDGQQNYAIARYFPDLEAAAERLDRPRYRLLRVLPPALASLAPTGAATVIALVTLNVIGLGIATFALARVATRRGGPALLGAIGASPLLVGLVAGTTGPIGWGLALLGLNLACQRRHGRAAVALTAATFCRETAALIAALVLLSLFHRERAHALRLAPFYALPGLALLAWYLYLGTVVEGDVRNPSRALDIVGLAGFEGLLVGAVIALGFAAVWLLRSSPTHAWPSLVITLWTFLYHEGMFDPLAIVRVNAVPITLGLVAVSTATTTRVAGHASHVEHRVSSS